MSHFNRSHVFGTVEKIEDDNKFKQPSLGLAINCAYPKHGNVKAFGRLWGKEAVESFKKQFKKGDSVRLTGALTQYTGDDKAVKTSFNFYKAEPWDPKQDQHSFKRATFILAGQVVSYQDGDEEGTLQLLVRLQAKGQDKPEEKTFSLCVPSSLSLDFLAEFPAGKDVRVKGRLTQTEDEFGDVVKYTRPLASEVSLLKEKAGAEEVPF